MKVSDAPFAKVEPYLLDGLDVYIGAEALIGAGLAAGAVGAVSGLASAFPEVVVEAVRSGDSTRAGELRALVEGYPRLPALKAVVAARGVPMREDVRPPLRGLTDRRAVTPPGRGPLGGQLVDRAARPLVHVGAASSDIVDRLWLRVGRCGGRRSVDGARFGQLRPELVHRWAVAPAPAQQRADAEDAGDESEETLHRPVTRAMLHSRRFSPRPSRRPRNGVQEAGPIQSMRRRNSGR